LKSAHSSLDGGRETRRSAVARHADGRHAAIHKGAEKETWWGTWGTKGKFVREKFFPLRSNAVTSKCDGSAIGRRKIGGLCYGSKVEIFCAIFW
jgi:hypothetical protein